MSQENHHSLQSEAIDAAAAAWLAELDEGLSAARAAEFERWRRADSRHEAAVARLEEATAILAQMPFLGDALRSKLTASEIPAPARGMPRAAFWTAAAMAAGLALAVAGRWVWTHDHGRNYSQTYSTPQGGYERVTLADGSVIELNSSSEVRVRYTAAERQVKLLGGVAQFSVAKNPARPFIVKARQVSVRAVGTAFEVRMEHSAVEVLVTEGRVQVGADGGQSRLLKSGTRDVSANDRPGAPWLVSAGEHVVVPTAGQPIQSVVKKISAPAGPAELAAQVPRLVFADTPLAEVVRQFNRVSRVQLELGDAELSARPVGGSFQADNVETFVRLLEGSGDIVVERPSPDRIVLRQPARGAAAASPEAGR